jgi:hypothetical protein
MKNRRALGGVTQINGCKPDADKFDAFVKSPQIVMPGLIRHPEHIELTGLALVLHYVSGCSLSRT